MVPSDARHRGGRKLRASLPEPGPTQNVSAFKGLGKPRAVLFLFHQPGNPDQDHRSHKGNDNRSDQSSGVEAQ